MCHKVVLQPSLLTGFSHRWAGLPNLFWMADRKKGVVNMVLSQVVPFNDPKTLTPWLAAEKVVYDSLDDSGLSEKMSALKATASEITQA